MSALTDGDLRCGLPKNSSTDAPPPETATPAAILQLVLTPTLSDALLIAHICQRQEHALALLYDRYSQLLYAIALRVTGDRSVAEEVIQDVFHAVWRTVGGFHPDGSVRAWLIGIARHRAIDATRARHFRAQNDTIPLDELRHMGTTKDVDVHVVEQLEHERVQRTLAELPLSQRQVIELAYYTGCTCAEIAARTSTPIGTVKTRLRLGIVKLRSLLYDARSV